MASCGRQLPDGSTQWDGLLTDVTTSRRTAEELEAQRSRLEIAVEATELGFWEWDPKADTLNWSDRLKALFGFPIDRPVTIEQYLGAIHPDDLERCLAMYRQARDRPGGGDFSMEYRITARSGHQHWILTRGRVLSDEHGPSLVVGTTVDVTERRAADERRALVVSELAHRVKNGLGVMMAIITETSRSAETVEDFKEVLISRLEAMAQAQDLVTASGGRPVLLADLAERTLAPFGLTRFDLENEVEGITVQGEVTAGLALLLHEMATNAVKYGALSTPEGRVALTAEEAGPGMAALHWRERGGPRVTPSERRGFGSKLLQAALRQQGGKVEPRFDPDGFRARMEFRVAS
jgi:PAS domain S-box-containing protein